jgi:hypothetical protein
MDNVIVLPGSKQLATAPDEKTPDIHHVIFLMGVVYLMYSTRPHTISNR